MVTTITLPVKCSTVKKTSMLCIAVLVTFLVFSGCVEQPSNVPDRYLRSDIYSLDRQMSVYGSFFLGSGYVGSYPSYFFYKSTGDGGYKLYSIPSKDCKVYLDSDAAYIQAKYVRSPGKVVPTAQHGEVGGSLISYSYGKYRNGDLMYAWYERAGDVEIHIPSNSTISRFNP